jgi:transposase
LRRSNTNKTSRSYTEEFKRDAVRLVETSGKSKTQIARDLGISDSALYRWLKEYGQALGASASASGQSGPSLTDLEAENKRLRREVKVLRQERDILKKAISICSQERG